MVFHWAGKKIKEPGLDLTDKHLYGYKILPVLGGKYEPANFELTGQIHKQIKDSPDGTKINIITE